MKYQYESVSKDFDQSFVSEELIGPVIDCVFHVHPEFEITYIESSFGVRFIGDSIAEFKAGDLFLTGALTPHHYLNSAADSTGETWSHFKVIKFSDCFAGPALFKLPEFVSLRHMLERADRGLSFDSVSSSAILPRINALFKSEGAQRVLLLLDILAKLADSSYHPLSSASTQAPVSLANERMSTVMNFIHTSINREHEFSLSCVAEKAGMTPQAFSTYFKKNTRKKFIDYVSELKIGRACALLTNTDMSIAQIALLAGFPNLSNFNRHFNRLKKITPRDYRALHISAHL